MYRQNCSGPTRVPWGTPDTTGTDDKGFPSIMTHWPLNVRKLSIHDSRHTLIPYCQSFRRRRRCGTLPSSKLEARS